MLWAVLMYTVLPTNYKGIPIVQNELIKYISKIGKLKKIMEGALA